MPGGEFIDVDRLILEAATGVRQLSSPEFQQVLEHVARAGFDPRPDKRGKTAAEKHYRKHVEVRGEWPDGTTLEDYLESARRVILDQRSSVAVSRYQGAWQSAALGEAGSAKGPEGGDWIVIEYRVGLGYWVTVFQPRDVQQDFLSASGREFGYR